MIGAEFEEAALRDSLTRERKINYRQKELKDSLPTFVLFCVNMLLYDLVLFCVKMLKYDFL